LHGWRDNVEYEKTFNIYGNDWGAVQQLMKENPLFAKRLYENLPYTAAEVIWATRHEMARTVEDILSRRTRALLLDAKASVAIAPQIAALMASELGYDTNWQKQQMQKYADLAGGYMLD
jgi:glycerol-3-phosphate dehydrogenase